MRLFGHGLDVIRSHLLLVVKHIRFILTAIVVLHLVLYARSISTPEDRYRVTMPDWDSGAGGGIKDKNQTSAVGSCRLDMRNLGPMSLDTSEPNMAQIEKANKWVTKGGSWSPPGCRPRQDVAVLVPYRDRWIHLQLLLRRLHPMLRQQNISYQVFVIEQAGNDTYNKGILFNAGVVEALKLFPFNCFIFHDVDLLPEDDRNIYYCNDHLRHFSSAINEWRYTLLYPSNAGGVVSLSYTNLFKINGFSNCYWGWGGEDDDFSYRTKEIGLLLTRPPQHIARYSMVRHLKRTRAPTARHMLGKWRSRWKTDGLNSLNQTGYKIIYSVKERLYTRYFVDVGQPPEVSLPSKAPTMLTHQLLFLYLAIVLVQLCSVL